MEEKDPKKPPLIGEKVKIIADHYNLSLNKMAARAHTTVAGLSRAIRDNATLSYDVLRKILIAFPEISPDWLIADRGSMLRESTITIAGCHSCAEKERVIIRLTEQIDKLNQSLELANQASGRAMQLAELYKNKIESNPLK